MDHLYIRCPSCAKLYQVDVTRIFSSSPEFQCVDCSTRFSFDFPPMDFHAVATRIVVAETRIEKTKKCPRCAAETFESAKECRACGVIFEKLEGLPEDRSLKAQPSLVRRWKELLADYGNESLHQEFVMSCRQQDAMEYASFQYRELKRLQGQDEIADRMLKRIGAIRSAGPGGIAARTKPATEVRPDLSSWGVLKQIGIFLPYVAGFLMVLWGLSPFGQRNMIGLGMAILLLSYSLLPEARESMKRFFRRA